VNFWMRLLLKSPTNTFPLPSTAVLHSPAKGEEEGPAGYAIVSVGDVLDPPLSQKWLLG